VEGESGGGGPTTDSLGSKSDNSAQSGRTTVTNWIRPKLDIACVIDLHSEVRKEALNCVKEACKDINNSNFYHIRFEKLDFGEANEIDKFYNADVAIIDLSVQVQQSALVYHLGVRDSFNMKQNVLLYEDIDKETTLGLKDSLSAYPSIVSYHMGQDSEGQLVVSGESGVYGQQSLVIKLNYLLGELQVQSKMHLKDKFLADLRKCRDQYSGAELKLQLRNMKRRLDDVNVLSEDVIHNMLISFREIQDYDEMVQLVENLQGLPGKKHFTKNSAIIALYAFALNRRHQEGDREKALQVTRNALKHKNNEVPDILCLAGRICKDKFVESEGDDKESLKEAITWYKKGFEVQPNEYAGVNLATLLVVSGESIKTSPELQRICIVLNNLIGKKGSLAKLEDYWDVATYFEISVLAEDYGKAIQASECMFRLKPPNWYLKSTIGNISLIKRFRSSAEDPTQPEEEVFNFWLEYFDNATKEGFEDTIRLPILIWEPNKVFMPSYVTVNNGAEEKSLTIENICIKCIRKDSTCQQPHEWTLTASNIKTVTTQKRDDRVLFLYVHSDDFQMNFANSLARQRFYDLVIVLTKGAVEFTDLDCQEAGPIDFEYDLDESQKKVLLGKGTFGIVYAARDLNTQIRVAVKEIPEKNIGDVQPLHEEIKLHSQLRHRNIVQYLGSTSEKGFFKIIMEQVPGGSLSALLRSKWGPLKDSEGTMAYYTKQILEGLKYLHDQKIVHRDIKGDNVLVNTYSGVVKISDFGTSKRLAGIHQSTSTFAGTMQYMAPEVVRAGQRGYGAPADIWSLGCTVVEMATGKPPFMELGTPQAAMFKVGFYRAHPEIPPEMSDMAKSFLARCFEPESEKRATATELLEDPFINDFSGKKKKMSRLSLTASTPGGEFNRSVSVPAPHLNRFNNRTPLSPDIIDSGTESCSVATSNDSILTPTEGSGLDNPLGQARRDSSGVLQSPDVLDPAKEDGFYHLKKDSQRRATLGKILKDDKYRICREWHGLLSKDVHDFCLSEQHLAILIEGMKGYIENQNSQRSPGPLQKAVQELRNALDYDGAMLNHLQLALYKVPEALNRVLRSHSIKPHWMFALEDLVRTAVQEAITILSPELGAHLGTVDSGADQPAVFQQLQHMDHNMQELGDEGVSTSGVSTVNSGLGPPGGGGGGGGHNLMANLGRLREENRHLLTDLLKAQESYQEILKQSLSDQRVHLQMLSQSFAASSLAAAANRDPVQRQAGVIEQPADPDLVNWLSVLGLSQGSVDRILGEDLTLGDVLDLMTRDDLKRLGLKAGPELRVWRAILTHRKEPLTPTSGP